MSSSQHWNPRDYARNARFVSDLGMPLLELLAPSPGERILDLGCGDGVLTAKLAALGCRVVGVDASADQVAAACARGLDVRTMSGEALAFDASFDAVFSNAALHWMKRADDVLDGVQRALLPGGRFVAEMGGKGNVESIRRALHAELDARGVAPWSVDPWFFPDPDQYKAMLVRHGFVVSYIELIPRPTPLPGDMQDWLRTLAGVFLEGMPCDQHGTFLAAVEERLATELRDADGKWTADYVRLRFLARKA
jgi:trans-aconitate methyltransferase